MAAQPLSENVQLISLPPEPQLSNEMEIAAHDVSTGADRDIIVDFSRAEILPSATICGLIVLERLLTAMDRHLILCAVPPNIVGIFKRVGLYPLLRFADNQAAAMKRLAESESGR